MKASHKFFLAAVNIVALTALLIWAFRTISLHEVVVAYEAMPKSKLAIVVGLNFFLLVLYGLRMSRFTGIRFAPSLSIIWLGFGFNNLLPLRLGELAKLAYARHLFGIPTSQLTAASALEKLYDLSAVLLLGLTLAPFISIRAIQAGLVSLAVLLIISIIGIVAILTLRHRWHTSKQRIFQWIGAVLRSLSDQSRGRQPMIIGIYTIAIWGTTVIIAYTMFSPLHAQFSWTDACLITLITALAVSIPGAPAGLGILEAGIIGYLYSVFKTDAATALTAALAFHLASALPQTLGAVGILGWKHIFITQKV